MHLVRTHTGASRVIAEHGAAVCGLLDQALGGTPSCTVVAVTVVVVVVPEEEALRGGGTTTTPRRGCFFRILQEFPADVRGHLHEEWVCVTISDSAGVARMRLLCCGSSEGLWQGKAWQAVEVQSL